MYEAVMWQHDSEFLLYVIWSCNNCVCTLSNIHTPKVVDGGLKRKRKIDGVCERDPAPVPCPQQNIDYLEIFNIINKGNGVEAKYELGGQSKTHRWTPKLFSRLFNLNFDNS